jgi:hypothetical protein
MMRKYRISILCTLAVLSAVHADDRENTQYAASPTDHPQWQQTSTALLSRNDYLRIVNDNREIVQRRLQAYSESLLACSKTRVSTVLQSVCSVLQFPWQHQTDAIA